MLLNNRILSIRNIQSGFRIARSLYYWIELSQTYTTYFLCPIYFFILLNALDVGASVVFLYLYLSNCVCLCVFDGSRMCAAVLQQQIMACF